MIRLDKSALMLTTSSIAFLAVGPAGAADQYPTFQYDPVGLPAVSGVNGKLEGFGGVFAGEGLAGVRGAISVPLDYRWGFQVDGHLGGYDGDVFGTLGGHLFWRDPTRALYGGYASFTHWDRFGGVSAGQIAGEMEQYWGRFTLRGIAGVEFGGSASGTVSVVAPVAAGGALFAPGTITTGTYNVDTNFFNQVDFMYYVTDNADVYVGHRYLGGEHALALGADVAFDVTPTTQGAVFVEARLGEDDFNGVWGGLKLHFGQTPKPLIARDREDDPNFWDALPSIVNTFSAAATQFCPASTSVVTTGGNAGLC